MSTEQPGTAGAEPSTLELGLRVVLALVQIALAFWLAQPGHFFFYQGF